MAELENPYQPPTSRVDDAGSEQRDSGSYIEGGRGVDSARGWAWIREGFQYFRRQTGMWLVLAVIFFALVYAAQHVPGIGQLALALLMPLLVGGLMTGCEMIRRGGELELAHLFAGFRRNAGQLVLIGVIGIVLSFVAVLPVILLTGFAFVTAGIGAGAAGGGAASLLAFGVGTIVAVLIGFALLIPINMALLFGPALVMLENQSAPRAIGQSFRGCLKNMVPFLVYGVIVLVLAILATIPLALGWLVLLPVGLCSVYAAYRDIFVQP
jgi:hypothetical protein